MSWYSDGEPFDEFDPPYCNSCTREDINSALCKECREMHEEWERESKLEPYQVLYKVYTTYETEVMARSLMEAETLAKEKLLAEDFQDLENMEYECITIDATDISKPQHFFHQEKVNYIVAFAVTGNLTCTILAVSDKDASEVAKEALQEDDVFDDILHLDHAEIISVCRD